MLAKYARDVSGVTLGDDYDVCRSKGLAVKFADMSFLPYEARSFDLIFARHVLEHSPMPLLTLMEWRRVSRKWLILVVPSLATFEWYGQNHYYVLLAQQWTGLIERAGWEIVWSEDSADEFEHRFCCEVSDVRNPQGFKTHPKDA
jgi:ubiquinone/menaquinone biosynthesis C-methylase UbiE